MGKPYVMTVEPTTFCNLKCPECISGTRKFTRKTGFIQPETFYKLIDQSKLHLTYLMLNFQGEPFLHPKIFSMIRYANRNNIYTSISTNGHFLGISNSEKIIKSGLDRIIISVDGLNAETYTQYRKGGDFFKVIQGLKNLVAKKRAMQSKTPKIIIQFLVLKTNEHQIEELPKFKAITGVDSIVLKSAQIKSEEGKTNLHPNNKKYARNNNAQKNRNFCRRLWTTAVVTQDALVVPCCYDKDAKYTVGDVATSELHEVWTNEFYDDFRNSIVNKNTPSICRDCPEGSRVIFPS